MMQKQIVKPDEEGFKTASNCRYPWFCVSVRVTSDSVSVRDTKDSTKTTLTYTHDEWAKFIEGVKAGEFDLPAK